MPDPTELRRIYSELIRLETELWDAVDRRLRDECGMSMASFDVMQVVAHTPNCRVYDIARELSITVGGTSKAVDRNEAGGRLTRSANPGDRRSSIIELTTAGADLLARAGQVVDDELARRLGSELSAAELDQLSTLIARIRARTRVRDA